MKQHRSGLTSLLFIAACIASLTFATFAGFGPEQAVVSAAGAARPLSAPLTAGGWYSHGPRGGEAHALVVTDQLVFAGGHRELTAQGDQTGSGLWRSENNGATWQPAGSGLDAPPAKAILDLAASPDFETDGILFAATWDGLYRSTDRGQSWQKLDGGLPVDPAAIQAIALSPAFAGDETLLAAAVHGGLFYSDDQGDTWTEIPGAPWMGSLALSPSFATDGVVLAGGADGEIYRSTDRGLSWTTVHSAGGPNVIQDIVFSPDFDQDSRAFAAGYGWGVLRSGDGGESWAVLPAWPGGALAQSLTISADFAQDGVLLAGTTAGVHRSDDRGDTWSDFGLDGQDVFALAYAADGQGLLAGTFNGIYRTDGEATGWQRGQGFAVLRADSLTAAAAAPAMKNASPALFAGTELGVYRSENDGLDWQPMTNGLGWGASFSMPHLAVSAGGGTIFAAWQSSVQAGAVLYRSGDGGQSWQEVHSSANYTGLALSPDFASDQTVFAGLANGFVARSVDGGASWTTGQIADSFSIHGLFISPDFANDQTVFAAGFGPLYRSGDGGQSWSAVPNSSGPLYGLAFSPDFAADGVMLASYRDTESDGVNPEAGMLRSVDHGQTWTLVNGGLPGWYEPFPGPLAASPGFAQNQTVYAGFLGFDFMGPRTPYQSPDGGRNWLALPALPVDLAANGIVAEAGQRALHLATDQGVWHLDSNCADLMLNPGFENDAGWHIPDTVYPAGYSTAQAHSGQRSMRTGIPPGGIEIESYSSFNQTIDAPADTLTITLSLWTYPLSEEAIWQVDKALPEQPQLYSLPDTSPLSGDMQYVLVLDENGRIIRTLMWTKSNAGEWLHAVYDLSDFAGQTIKIHIGTYNDTKDGLTTMYADDVTLSACRAPDPLPTSTPTPAPPTATPTATPTRPAFQFWLPLLLRSAISPTPTATQTPTPTSTATATATPEAVPTFPTMTPTPTATATPGG